MFLLNITHKQQVKFSQVMLAQRCGKNEASRHPGCSLYVPFVCLVQGEAVLEPFDPLAPQPKMIHKGGYQPRYFFMESFEVREPARLACQKHRLGWATLLLEKQ